MIYFTADTHFGQSNVVNYTLPLGNVVSGGKYIFFR